MRAQRPGDEATAEVEPLASLPPSPPARQPRAAERAADAAKARTPARAAAEEQQIVKDMQELFDIFDDDGGGTIEATEFGAHLNQGLGMSLDETALKNLFEEIDFSGNGSVRAASQQAATPVRPRLAPQLLDSPR